LDKQKAKQLEMKMKERTKQKALEKTLDGDEGTED